MEEKMEVKIDQTIDYSQLVKRDSSYKYTKLIQNTGQVSFPLNSSTQTTTFEIPVVGFNLAQSSIKFTQEFKAATHYTSAFRHTPPWSRLELFTRGGQYLCDVTNFSHVYTAFGQRTKKIEDFHGSEDGIIVKQIPQPAAFGADVANAAAVPNATADDLAAINVVVGNINNRITALNLGIARLNTVATSVSAALQSSSEIQLKKLASSADNGPLKVNWRIPGSDLYNTVMSLDKTIVIGEVLNLRITWRELAAHGFTSDDLASPPTNPGVIAEDVKTQVNKLAMFLAQETNQTVLEDLSRVVSTRGLSVLIPYTHAYKTTLPNDQGSHAISVRLSRGHGISLERIYTLFGSGAEALNTRYDAKLNPVTGATTQGPNSFYSLLDSKRLQEFDINVETEDYDWTKRGEKKDRVVSLSVGNDNELFAHSENFCGDDLECAVHQHIGGLDLSVERKYDVYINRGEITAGGLIANPNYYTAAVCQKQLMIGPGGISVM